LNQTLSKYRFLLLFLLRIASLSPLLFHRASSATTLRVATPKANTSKMYAFPVHHGAVPRAYVSVLLAEDAYKVRQKDDEALRAYYREQSPSMSPTAHTADSTTSSASKFSNKLGKMSFWPKIIKGLHSMDILEQKNAA
jgi:hypothetical protein